MVVARGKPEWMLMSHLVEGALPPMAWTPLMDQGATAVASVCSAKESAVTPSIGWLKVAVTVAVGYSSGPGRREGGGRVGAVRYNKQWMGRSVVEALHCTHLVLLWM